MSQAASTIAADRDLFEAWADSHNVRRNEDLPPSLALDFDNLITNFKYPQSVAEDDFHQLFEVNVGWKWDAELDKLRILKRISTDDNVVPPDIKQRNEKFKKDTPALLFAWKIFRESLEFGEGFVNEAALRLPVDILLKLVWRDDLISPDYSYLMEIPIALPAPHGPQTCKPDGHVRVRLFEPSDEKFLKDTAKKFSISSTNHFSLMLCQPIGAGFESKVRDYFAAVNQFTMLAVAAFRHRQAIGMDEISDRNIVYGIVQVQTTVHLFVARLYEVKGKPPKVAIHETDFIWRIGSSFAGFMRFYLQLLELVIKFRKDFKELAESSQARRQALMRNHLHTIHEEAGPEEGEPGQETRNEEAAPVINAGTGGSGGEHDLAKEMEDSVDPSATESEDPMLASERVLEEQQSRKDADQEKLDKSGVITSWLGSLPDVVETRGFLSDCNTGLSMDNDAPAGYDDTIKRAWALKDWGGYWHPSNEVYTRLEQLVASG